MKRYEAMRPDEDMSWCSPYVSDDKKFAFIETDGDINSVLINGEYLPKPYNRDNVTKEFAKYGIDMDDLPGTGCVDCPWRDECEVMDLQEEEYTYWLETDYIYGDFSVEKWALHKKYGELDEIVLWKSYDDTPNYPADKEDVDGANKAIDDYIEQELGILPEYDVN